MREKIEGNFPEEKQTKKGIVTIWNNSEILVRKSRIF